MQSKQSKESLLLTIAEAAAVFAVTRRTIHNWIKGGLLAASKIGGVVRIRRSDVEKLIGGVAQ
jgi:excisionase family DNA binding protein